MQCSQRRRNNDPCLRLEPLSTGLPAAPSLTGTRGGAGKSHPLSHLREGSIHSSVHLRLPTYTDYKNNVGLSLALTLYVFPSIVLLKSMK